MNDPSLFKVINPLDNPDMFCASTIAAWSDAANEEIGVDCALEDDHDVNADPDEYVHTDGDGTWWNAANDIEYR